ncbi:MAG: IS66 family insertion sequence element accessory protein TnpB [Gammaproteobacteria bacterium]|nr:IS66 family insertion sequence element accessory protein TnpB [Gammaproteobacteria bacterium]
MHVAIDSLVYLVTNEFGKNPQLGHLFLFYNKRKDKGKLFSGMVSFFTISGWKSIVFMFQRSEVKTK